MANKNTHAIRRRFREPAAIEPEILPTHMEPEDLNDDWEVDGFLPPGADLSRISTVGKPREFQRSFARELMWQADECNDLLTALSLAVRAVRIDPASLDARVFLAMFAAGPADEYIEELRRIVAVGERDLGASFFKKNGGMFWQIMETRPYMRARSQLAHLLHVDGRVVEAIAEYEALLVLNPNDNQGLRYSLIGCYLEEERLDGAIRLLQEYAGDGSAMFAWARVLERYLSGELGEAVQALACARMANAHVEDFLTGKKKPPKSRPETYQYHHVSEAWVCVDEIGGAWSRHREAILWLKKEHGSGHLFVSERRSGRTKTKPN